MNIPRSITETVYDEIISLGGNCEIAHHLRESGVYLVKGVFDWLVTPIASVVEIVRNEAKELGETIIAANDGTSAKCKKYSALLHHEFPRAENNELIISNNYINNCISKLLHKYNTLHSSLQSNSIKLLVRYGLETDLNWDGLIGKDTAQKAEQVIELYKLLSEKYDNAIFKLVILIHEDSNEINKAINNENIFVHTIPKNPDAGWAISGSDWKIFISQFRFSFSESYTKLDETLHWSGES